MGARVATGTGSGMEEDYTKNILGGEVAAVVGRGVVT